MADESYELAVALNPEGADETQEALDETEGSFEDTADAVDESADEMEGFSQRWRGAMTAIVSALSVAAAGLLSQVPAVGEAMAGLNAVVSAVAFQIDSGLRPALVPVTDVLFGLADAIFAADGATGTLIGVLGTLAVVGFAVAGALIAVGGLLPSLTISGVLGSVIGAMKTVAGALLGFVTGSLAAAAAFGAFIGLLGVGILEKTGILDAVRDLGAAVGQALPAAVRDGMLSVLGYFLGPLIIAGAAIAGFVSGVLDGGLREGIDRAVSNARQALDIFVGAWRRTLSRIGDVIGDVIDRAFSWGRALIDEFVSGVRSMRDEVADAAGDIAAEARAHLPGSPADEGPLSDLDETGPAFAETFAAGMDGGLDRVRSSAVQVAGAANGSAESDQTSIRVSQSAPSIYLDGREIERETSRYRRDDTSRRGL